MSSKPRIQDYLPGQRWVSDTELKMGLGKVIAVDFRTVTLLFLATEETRTYAKQTAPLSRIIFNVGDLISDQYGQQFTVLEIRDTSGLVTYHAQAEGEQSVEIPEGELDHFIQLNRAGDRLFGGQIDQDKWFELRCQTLSHLNRLMRQELFGLTGVRTTLLAHQLYLTHEIANRYAPRVLLADEVGLGKTIEAGLIIHHQLLTERSHRVLIVVPETLVHQWLVEMLRRFNLNFSVFDEERCQAIEASSGLKNPFESEQLVLCHLNFLLDNPRRVEQALLGNWDLLVVDEAHHLEWSQKQPSDEYQVVEALAAITKGVLLLTATPEQLGKDAHFARLRLLDPDRFPTLEQFLAEEKLYEPIANSVIELLNPEPLSKASKQTLSDTITEGDNATLLATVEDQQATPEDQQTARLELVEHLLDRHGTGRVLYRNTRAAIKGFPARKVFPHPLPLPSQYKACFENYPVNDAQDMGSLLRPERMYETVSMADEPNWVAIDPRAQWLMGFLQTIKPEKALVITAAAETAMDLVEFLRVKAGTHAALFHELLTIVDRDRAAAFFADQEQGSQVLICSEIGSEGRNFQFAHHLVLFDLPFNPDLLEQRIGRLDRIGQKETIQIHIPYLENSAQSVMFEWYQKGLSAFEKTCPVGHTVFTQTELLLSEAITQPDNQQKLTDLISTTQDLHQTTFDQLQRGRDPLLEFNSCRPHIADELVRQAKKTDAESELLNYLDKMFDCYGIDMEDHRAGSYIIRPGEKMQTTGFPGLLEEGMTITCDREIALSHEDIHYLTWEHPLVTGAMSMIISNEQGNAAFTTINIDGVKAGMIMLECQFLFECSAPETLQSNRYLPPTSIRVLIDQQGVDHAQKLSQTMIGLHRKSVDQATANQVIRAYNSELKAMLEQAEAIAQQQAPKLLKQAFKQSKQTLLKEINRLKALQRVNPNVRQTEIDFFEKQQQALNQALKKSSLRLDAVRAVVSI